MPAAVSGRCGFCASTAAMRRESRRRDWPFASETGCSAICAYTSGAAAAARDGAQLFRRIGLPGIGRGGDAGSAWPVTPTTNNSCRRPLNVTIPVLALYVLTSDSAFPPPAKRTQGGFPSPRKAAPYFFRAILFGSLAQNVPCRTRLCPSSGEGRKDVPFGGDQSPHVQSGMPLTVIFFLCASPSASRDQNRPS
jgi:hypothetical protein